MAYCDICEKKITPSQKIIRVLVEAAYRAETDDPRDPAGWSRIEDWEEVVLMHLSCVKRAWHDDDRIPYGREVNLLAIDSIDDSPVMGGRPVHMRRASANIHEIRAGTLALEVIDGGI